MPSKLKIHSALLTVGLIYGANYSIAKLLMPLYIGPLAIILVRVVIGTALFWLVHALQGGEKIRYKRDYIQLALLSLFGVAINQLMFFKGLSLTNPISASVIMTTSPITVLIVSYIVLRERITPRKVIGILLGATGAVLLIGTSGFSFSSDTFTGNLFVLINATSFSIYLVLVKPMMLRYQPLTVVKWVFLFGSFVVIPFGVQEFTMVDWAGFSTEAWLSLTYVVIGTTFFAYLLNTWALNFVSPSVVGYYIYLQPVFSTVIAVVFRDDVLSFTQVVESMLIFSGVFLVSYSPSRQK
jgi:drug/metabolite transporter (DMT)-like permease